MFDETEVIEADYGELVGNGFAGLSEGFHEEHGDIVVAGKAGGGRGGGGEEGFDGGLDGIVGLAGDVEDGGSVGGEVPAHEVLEMEVAGVAGAAEGRGVGDALVAEGDEVAEGLFDAGAVVEDDGVIVGLAGGTEEHDGWDFGLFQKLDGSGDLLIGLVGEDDAIDFVGD